MNLRLHIQRIVRLLILPIIIFANMLLLVADSHASAIEHIENTDVHAEPKGFLLNEYRQRNNSAQELIGLQNDMLKSIASDHFDPSENINTIIPSVSTISIQYDRQNVFLKNNISRAISIDTENNLITSEESVEYVVGFKYGVSPIKGCCGNIKRFYDMESANIIYEEIYPVQNQHTSNKQMILTKEHTPGDWLNELQIFIQHIEDTIEFVKSESVDSNMSDEELVLREQLQELLDVLENKYEHYIYDSALFGPRNTYYRNYGDVYQLISTEGKTYTWNPISQTVSIRESKSGKYEDYIDFSTHQPSTQDSYWDTIEEMFDITTYMVHLFNSNLDSYTSETQESLLNTPRKVNLDELHLILTEHLNLNERTNEIIDELVRLQDLSDISLVVSQPNDPDFIYHDGIQEDWARININSQAFTYDQALSGIALLHGGEIERASNIFNFFYNEWQEDRNSSDGFEGFWTTYNIHSDEQWKRYEWRKGMGENAWIALFALQYSQIVQDPTERIKSESLAVHIASWIASLPHHNGGVAMGNEPPWNNVYSVENNLDYYAVLEGILNTVTSIEIPASFRTELENLRDWLNDEQYNQENYLFQRGGVLNELANIFEEDSIQSLDVNSWALTSIGADTLLNVFDMDIHQWVNAIESRFAVDGAGNFASDFSQIAGFDFSDQINAQSIGRPGMIWYEGTAQMAVFYNELSKFYSNLDLDLSKSYLEKSTLIIDLLKASSYCEDNSCGYLYASQEEVQIYSDNPNLRTPIGFSLPSLMWIYFAENGINPFRYHNSINR